MLTDSTLVINRMVSDKPGSLYDVEWKKNNNNRKIQNQNYKNRIEKSVSLILDCPESGDPNQALLHSDNFS